MDSSWDMQISWISQNIPDNPWRRRATRTSHIYATELAECRKWLYPRISIFPSSGAVEILGEWVGRYNGFPRLWMHSYAFVKVRVKLESFVPQNSAIRECHILEGKSGEIQYEGITRFKGFWCTAMSLGRSKSSLIHLYRRLQSLKECSILDKFDPWIVKSWKSFDSVGSCWYFLRVNLGLRILSWKVSILEIPTIKKKAKFCKSFDHWPYEKNAERLSTENHPGTY